MKFGIQHTFLAPRAEVLDLVFDPDFNQNLELPDVGPPTLLDQRTVDSTRILITKMHYTGSVDPLLRRLAGSNLSWTQTLSVDSRTGRGTLEIEPDVLSDRVQIDARIQFDDRDGRCIRNVEGRLDIRIPLVGSSAAKPLLKGILQRLDIEADAINTRLEALN